MGKRFGTDISTMKTQRAKNCGERWHRRQQIGNAESPTPSGVVGPSAAFPRRGVNGGVYPVNSLAGRFYLFLERGEGKERNIDVCLSHAPYWGLSPQPRHVP